LRDCTERPEGIDAGVATLVGTEAGRIVAEVLRLALDPAAYARMSSARSPYGDGRSSVRIRTALLEKAAAGGSGLTAGAGVVVSSTPERVR
jgi:UDP-N-acetylglucosamine 2-epimerase (non-hydrolysing)